MTYAIYGNVKILVIGDLILDHYIYGSCNRISPEAPVPVVEVKKESYTLGGAGNVLKNIISLGCQANIISITGNDTESGIVEKHLQAQNINGDGIFKDNSRCTTIKSRVLVSNHQLIRLDREITKPVDNIMADKLLKVVTERIKDYDILLLSDYNKGLFTEYLLSKLFAICRKLSIKTILDPKGADFSKYKGVNIIKPNKKEAIMATGIDIVDEDTLRAACAKLKEQTNCDSVVITMSEEGMAYYSDGVLDVIPTRALAVVDVTGAGDTVLAALGVALAANNTLHNACDFANHAAAVVVNKVGSATSTLAEIDQRAI